MLHIPVKSLQCLRSSELISWPPVEPGATVPHVDACASLNHWLCCICKVTPFSQIGPELPSKFESCGGRGVGSPDAVEGSNT